MQLVYASLSKALLRIAILVITVTYYIMKPAVTRMSLKWHIFISLHVVKSAVYPLLNSNGNDDESDDIKMHVCMSLCQLVLTVRSTYSAIHI